MSEDNEKTAIGVVDEQDRTQMMTEPEGGATQYSASVECPVCKTASPPSETYCTDCGFLLSSEPGVVTEVVAEAHSARLVTSDGVREFPLKDGENTVGRENADVVLTHNTVSRGHARVFVDGGVFVEDTGSTNGTYVDGKKIEPNVRVELADGADVTFGSLALRLALPEASEAEETVVLEESAEDEIAESEQEEAAGDEVTVTFDEESEQSGEESPETEPIPEPAAETVGRLVSTDGTMTFNLSQGDYTIGRREGDNDIVVVDAYCSGSHAKLEVGEDTFTITDVGSTNGTLLNGVRLTPDDPNEIKPGDVLTIGQTEFTIEVG